MWLNAGHEVFQEARAQTSTLLEQAIAGYHEGNDVVCVTSHPEFIAASGARGAGIKGGHESHGDTRKSTHGSRIDAGGRNSIGGKCGREEGTGSSSSRRPFEDSYIDNVLRTRGGTPAEAQNREQSNTLRSPSRQAGCCGNSSKAPGTCKAEKAGRGDQATGPHRDGSCADRTEMGSMWDGSTGEVYGSSWESYRHDVTTATANAAGRGTRSDDAGAGSASDEDGHWRKNVGVGVGADPCTTRNRGKGGKRRERGRHRRGLQGQNAAVKTVLDASHPAFERQGNLVYGFGQGSKVYPQPEEFPEVRT